MATPKLVSAVFKGTAFEERSRAVLRDHFSMSLRRVGGRGDGGIDLQGWWWLPAQCVNHGHPSATHALPTPARPHDRVPVRVLGQCKAEARKVGPRHIREFEGTVLRLSAAHPLGVAASPGPGPGPSPRASVGVFLSLSPFTLAALRQAYSSPVPLALVHLPEPGDGCAEADRTDARMPGNVIFNPALSASHGLLRGTLEPRWERGPGEGGPALWSGGSRLESWVPEDARDARRALGVLPP
ncbi:uncharacterized protein BXZ73DRAFT_98456 [Epithele typhae]|uniref:uncharacterized protein n=1 Tax=Epithele typhae TaxID=378194 RepID=UPI002007850C|nr:uncharacterized protein BXZ73DRAFT_98456 [Epithele typhae]KAH9941241.1 hypothetical protein BXZ73DRAFT_98456 [Epithele typhae]